MVSWIFQFMNNEAATSFKRMSNDFGESVQNGNVVKVTAEPSSRPHLQKMALMFGGCMTSD